METPHNRRFYLEVQSSFPLATLYRIWDKSEVLWKKKGWGTHWELGEHIENLMGTLKQHLNLLAGPASL